MYRNDPGAVTILTCACLVWQRVKGQGLGGLPLTML